MSAEWICVYRSPGRDIEVWELRHRSGALLAEVDTLRGAAEWMARYRTARKIWMTIVACPHRRDVRVILARVHTEVRDLEAMSSPPSITDEEPSIVEENAETIRQRTSSVRARRRAKLADKIALVQQIALDRGILLPRGEVLR